MGLPQGFAYALNQQLVYVARRFPFHGKLLIIRTAFPLQQVNELTDRFEFGFFTLGFVVHHLFSIMTTAIALETSKGNLSLALGLGIALLLITFLVNAAAFGVREAAARRAALV